MANVRELRNELTDIGRHLGEQSQVLLSIASKLNELGYLTANVMSETTRSDVEGPALEGIMGASQNVSDAAAELVVVREGLDEYAASL